MNTWTDSGLSEAGLIGAKLAVGLEARLPDGPARSRGDGSRALRAAPDDSSSRGGRRHAAEPGVVPVPADRAVPQFGVPAADVPGRQAVDVPAASPSMPASGLAAAASGPSSLTGSFPLSGVAKLYTPEPVPLPSEPLPSEPLPSDPLPPEPGLARPEPSTSSAQPSHSASEDRDRMRSSTDGFLAGGFSSSSDSSDAHWDLGRDSDSDSGSHGLSSGSSVSWSRPVPITPQSLDPAVSAPTTVVRHSEISPAVSEPTSLLPMPKRSGSHRARSDDSEIREVDERVGAHSARESFNVESSALGSLDGSGLFAALSHRSR